MVIVYFLFNSIIRNIFIIEIFVHFFIEIFAHFFIGVYIIVFFDRIIYIYFSTKELWFPRLKYYVHYAETAAHSAYGTFSRVLHGRDKIYQSETGAPHVTAFSSRVFAKRKRETESKVQIELGIRIRGNFHESKGGELCDRDGKLCLNLSWYKNTR